MTSSTLPAPYVGRFAPSPTGPLHFGSLVAATASYLDARSRQGQWLLRMEDVDAPRCSPAAATAILRALEQFGFRWDGPVVYQSTRQEHYRGAFDRLVSAGFVYPCACTRRELTGARYPGTCRSGLAGRPPRAFRVRVRDEIVCFNDRVQGDYAANLEFDGGDFVLLRADGYWAYQLAVVVDDYLQGVTHVVRGADLMDSTPRQIHLQRLLGYPAPHYLHVPVAIGANGEKLSKQTGAPPIEPRTAAPTLHRALEFLGQSPPPGALAASSAELWAWALAHWRPDRIPARPSLPLS